jgi:hypothetical protein
MSRGTVGEAVAPAGAVAVGELLAVEVASQAVNTPRSVHRAPRRKIHRLIGNPPLDTGSQSASMGEHSPPVKDEQIIGDH